MAESFAKFLFAEGYWLPRRLPNGEWIAVRQFMFTWGLMVGLDEFGYRTRFCYERQEDAFCAALTWNGEGDPPGPWIKEKGRGVDRSNPNPPEVNL